MNLMFGRSGILRNNLSIVKLLFRGKPLKAAKIFKSSAFAAKAALLATLVEETLDRKWLIISVTGVLEQ
jgi:hypothetical protein